MRQARPGPGSGSGSELSLNFADTSASIQGAGPQFDGVSGILELAGGEVAVSGRYWDSRRRPSRTGQYLPGRGVCG
jgi:hypothetical protein